MLRAKKQSSREGLVKLQHLATRGQSTGFGLSIYSSCRVLTPNLIYLSETIQIFIFFYLLEAVCNVLKKDSFKCAFNLSKNTTQPEVKLH